MKRRFWIGGVLLLMFFTGMTGCGGPKEPPPEHMLDGPDMMYTPEDQTPYAGTWQSRDGTIVMKVERGGGAESESDMSLSVNGEPEFEAKLWVYSTGHVELLRGKEKVTISGTFCNLLLQHERKRLLRLSYRQHGMIWLTKDGTECSGKDVIYTERSEQPGAIREGVGLPRLQNGKRGEFLHRMRRSAPCGLREVRLAAHGRKTFCVLSGMWKPPKIRRTDIDLKI